MIQVCIVDDHRLFREGLKQLIQDEKKIKVIDEMESAEEYQRALATRYQLWDVLILDISLGDACGLELARQTKSEYPDLPTLILTMHHEQLYGVRAYSSGASAFLTKDSVPQKLMKVIEQLARGEKYISHQMTEKLLHIVSYEEKIHSYDKLSNQEFFVLTALGKGKRLSEVAKESGLSIKTISTYKKRIFDKLGIENNAQLIQYCMENKVS